MKRTIILMILLALTLLYWGSPASADATADYQAIKKAESVRGDESLSKNVSFLRIEVFDKKAKKVTVTLKLPFSLVEILADSTNGDIKIEDKCNINLKKIVQDLKKSGPMTLLEVDEEDEHVKIWFE